MTPHERHAVSSHGQLGCCLNRSLRLKKENIKAQHYWTFVQGIHQWVDRRVAKLSPSCLLQKILISYENIFEVNDGIAFNNTNIIIWHEYDITLQWRHIHERLLYFKSPAPRLSFQQLFEANNKLNPKFSITGPLGGEPPLTGLVCYLTIIVSCNLRISNLAGYVYIYIYKDRWCFSFCFQQYKHNDMTSQNGHSLSNQWHITSTIFSTASLG